MHIETKEDKYGVFYAIIDDKDGNTLAAYSTLARAEYEMQAAAADGAHRFAFGSPTVKFTDTCIEHAYGTAQRLSFQVRVF